MGRRGLAAAGIAVLAIAWAAWLAAIPIVAADRPDGATLLGTAATYQVGSIICHQRPDRSFHIGGVQTPVCARCLGLYGGAAVGAMVGIGWGRRRSRGLEQSRMRLSMLRIILLVAAVPTVALWALEHASVLGVTNLARFTGALPLGAAVAWFVVAWVAGARFDDNSARAIH